MNENIFDEALQELRYATVDLKNLEIIHSYDVSKIENALKLGKLYKELSNYVDEQTYAHELPKITQLKIKIKELENE